MRRSRSRRPCARRRGATVAAPCREKGISRQAFHPWRRESSGLGVVELRRLKPLEQENRRLKQLVADLSLDETMLQDVIERKP